MSTIKISALPSGNPAQSGDEIPIARSGTSYKITAGSIADLGGNVSGPSSSVNNQIALFAGTAGDSIQAASTTGVLKATSGVIAAAVPGVDYGDVSGADTISTDNALARFDGTSGKVIQKSVATLSDAGALALPGTANTLTLSGSSTGNPATIATTGTDTNIELKLTGKGFLGGVSLGTDGGTALFAYTFGSVVNRLAVAGSPSGSNVILGTEGSDSNISLNLFTAGSGIYDFFTNTSDRQFRVAHTANSYNYLEVTGGNSSSARVKINAQGSDANVVIQYLAKNSGFHVFSTGGGEQFRVGNLASAVNYLQARGGVTGSGAELMAGGSDSNIDILLTPKGTGNVSFGTYTGTILVIAGYIEIKDSGGTVRKLAVVA
jgi:hypothetical protein